MGEIVRAAPAFARELRRRRCALGLTQKELAAKLGIAKNTYARWERGDLEPANPTMLDLALKRIEKEAK